MRSHNKRINLGRNVEIGSQVRLEEGAKIHDNVRIGPFTQILRDSVIGDHCVIGSHCIIGHPSKLQLQKMDFSVHSPKVAEFIVKDSATRIGEGSIIRSGSTVYMHVIVGKRLRTGHNVLIREHTALGDDCVVGTQAILDGYIKVGDKSLIQSQCYVAQSVKIGNGVFVAPRCVFLDNKRIILGQGLEGSTIEDYVRIGGGAKILPGITIHKYAFVSSGSVVTKDVPSKAIVSGIPAKVKRFQTNEEIETYVNSILNWK